MLLESASWEIMWASRIWACLACMNKGKTEDNRCTLLIKHPFPCWDFQSLGRNSQIVRVAKFCSVFNSLLAEMQIWASTFRLLRVFIHWIKFKSAGEYCLVSSNIICNLLWSLISKIRSLPGNKYESKWEISDSFATWWTKNILQDGVLLKGLCCKWKLLSCKFLLFACVCVTCHCWVLCYL